MSLVELIVALVLASGVTLALGHIVTQVTRGVTRLERRSQRQTEAALALLRLRIELREALGVSALTTRRIAITHPDVTGDSIVDTITYDWDATAGSNLTREVNAGGAETILEQCLNFTITGLTQLPTTEELLTGHVGYGPGVAAATQEFTVTSTNLAAQVFTLTRTGAASFRVTGVRLRVCPLIATGSLLVSLRQASGSDPSTVTIETASRPIAQLTPGGGWESFRFAGGTSLTCGDVCAIVVQCGSSGGSVGVSFDQITQNVPLSSPDFYRFSTNGGSSWQPNSNLAARDLKYLLHGRWVSSGGSTLAISAGYVQAVQVRLEAGDPITPVRFEATEQCVHLPELVQ